MNAPMIQIITVHRFVPMKAVDICVLVMMDAVCLMMDTHVQVNNIACNQFSYNLNIK